MFKWAHSLPSKALLAVIVCLSSAVMERKQPGRYLSNIALILLALGRAPSQKMLWLQQRNSSVRSCARGLYMQQSKSEGVLPRSPATMICLYHAFTLSSDNLEPSSPATSWSSSSGWNGKDAQRRSVSAAPAVSATHAQSLQEVHFMWIYQGMPQPTLQVSI